jgi:stage V sporulation protein R
MFGPEWDTCDSLAERESWDKQLGLGLEKIFQVRKLYNDVTFIDEFFTPDFVERQRLYTFGYNPKSKQWEIETREFEAIKAKLLDSLTNFGQPQIDIVDANFRNRSELLLRHRYHGVPLDAKYAREVLRSLHRIWKRPVHLETVLDDAPRLLGFDGSSITDETCDPTA